MMHRSFVLLTLIGAFWGAGCVDIAIPGDAIISCGEGGACPGGTSCNDVINRCVPEEPIETDAPSVSGVAIAPASGRVGTTFTVGFAVDEPLGIDPIVTVDIGGAEPVRLSAIGGDKNDPAVAWSFSYDAAGTEVEGNANAFARVVDIWGNERTAALAPGLSFDFTAPVVTDPGLPTTINVVELGFVLAVEGASRLAVTGDIEDDKDLVVTGDEVDIDVVFVAGDGPKTLQLVASDEVGNTTTLDLDFTLDSTVPFSAPIITARDGQSSVKNNDTLDVTGQVSAGATLVNSRLLDQDNNFLRNVTGVIISAAGVISGSVAIGALGTATSLRLEVTVVDGGVPSVDAQSRSNVIAIDNLPPTSPSCALPARVVTANVGFLLSAADFIDVEVVGDVVEPRPFLPLAGNASSGTVNLILSGAEGNKTLTARFRDGAHNIASCSATTRFDAGAPVVTDVLLVPPAGQSAVRSNQVVTIAATVDVPGTTVVSARLLNAAFGFIANVPGVTVVGGSVSGSFLVSSLVVGAPPAGIVLELIVTDGALNSLAVRSPQLDIDNVPPTNPVLSAPADIGAFTVDVDIGGCVGAEAVAVSGDVAVDDGVFVPFPVSGTLSVTVTAGIGAKTITAQCRDRAFNLSGTANVVVNLTTDDVLSLPTLTLPGTQTAVKNGDTLTIGGTGEAGASIVAVRLVNVANGAVAQTLANNVLTLAGNGSMSGSFVTSGLTNATNVALEVILNARGRNSVAAASRSAASSVDLLVPAAPTRSSLRLVENTAAVNDPARLNESVDNSFTVTGLGAAVLDGVSVDVCGEAACTTVIDSAAVVASGFAPTNFAHRASHEVFVRAVDAAGNRSTTTRVAVPRISFTSVAPAAANAADDVIVSFTTNIAVVTPVVRVDNNLAVLVSETGNDYVFRYNTIGTEGDGVTVVRVTAEDDTGTAPGTTGTDATTTILDFTAPVIVAGRVTLAQNDPGSNDTVSGIAAAVDDVEDAIIDLAIDGGAAGLANADGSFGALSAGDNVADVITLRATDDAGNQSSITLQNDRLAPVLSQVVVPEAKNDGAVITVSFRLVDARSSLRADPVVTIGGRAAVRTAGNANETPINEVFSYNLTANKLVDTEGNAVVAVSFVDNVGNAGSGSDTVNLDFTRPVLRNTTPGDRPTWTTLPAVFGTAKDVGATASGIDHVEISVQQCDTVAPCVGDFLDVTAFSSVARVLVNANVVSARGDWSVSLDSTAFTDLQDYQLVANTIDVAGNKSLDVVRDFSFDARALPQPTNLVATLIGSTVRLTWTAPIVPATGFQVYYDTQSSGAPPYLGSSVAPGDSPIAVVGNVVTFDVVGLDPDAWFFVVTGEDAGGVEGAYSNEVEAVVP